MELSRLIGGGCPMVTNIMVYKAGSILDQGAVVCVTANTATLKGAVISVTTDTSANDNALGVTQADTLSLSVSKENLSPSAAAFNIGSDGFPDATTLTSATTGNFAPVCINPDALYYAAYSTLAGATSTGDSKVVGISATVGTSVVLGSNGVNHAAGWLYSSVSANSAGATPTFSGELRWVAATAASDTFGLLTAMNVSTDGTMLVVAPSLIEKTCLSSGGNMLRSHGAGTVGQLAQGLFIVDNYVVHDAAPLHPLRAHVDDGLNALTGTRLYSEVAINKHILNNTT